MASVDWATELTTYLAKAGTPELQGVGPLLAALGAACQDAAEQEMGRTFDEQEYQELYTGDGRPFLFLNHDPITALLGVTLNGNALLIGGPYNNQNPPPVLSNPGVVLPTCIASGVLGVPNDPKSARIEITDGTVFDLLYPCNILVHYKAGLSFSNNSGTAPPPAGLIKAVCIWASYLFRDRDRIGIQSQTVREQITMYTRDVPSDVERMLWNYRREVWP
jgi:hypothetical protein